MKNTFYHVDLWEEQQMRFGTGLAKLCDSYWYPEKIKEKISNWRVMEKLNGINGLHVVKRLDGTYFIIQISGYTEKSGMYCHMVKEGI